MFFLASFAFEGELVSMTQGETLFYLREIQGHWSTSNVSTDKLAELEAAKLIEINASPVPAVRLTSEGVRCKALGHRHATQGGLTLTGKAKVFRQRARKAALPRPKPLA
jgi:hypothetical protein